MILHWIVFLSISASPKCSIFSHIECCILNAPTGQLNFLEVWQSLIWMFTILEKYPIIMYFFYSSYNMGMTFLVSWAFDSWKYLQVHWNISPYTTLTRAISIHTTIIKSKINISPSPDCWAIVNYAGYQGEIGWDWCSILMQQQKIWQSSSSGELFFYFSIYTQTHKRSKSMAVWIV